MKREIMMDEFYAEAKRLAALDPFYHDAVLIVEEFRLLKREVRSLRNTLRSMEHNVSQMLEQSERFEI